MVVAHHVADDIRRLAIGAVPVVAALLHAVKDAAVDRLEAVAYVRQSARHDHAHGVIQVRAAYLLFDGDRRDVARRRWGRWCRVGDHGFGAVLRPFSHANAGALRQRHRPKIVRDFRFANNAGRRSRDARTGRFYEYFLYYRNNVLHVTLTVIHEGNSALKTESVWYWFCRTAKIANHRFGRARSPASAISCSERDFVVQVRGRRRLGLAAPGSSRRRGWLVRGKAAVTARTCAIEHRELATEFLQHHFGRVFLLARLIGPFARLQRALQINLGALFQVLLDDVDQPVIEYNDAMPLGALFALTACLVAPAFRGCHGHVGDAGAVVRRADLGIAAEIADQDHLVDASGHRPAPSVFRRLVNRGVPAHLWASGAVWQAFARLEHSGNMPSTKLVAHSRASS